MRKIVALLVAGALVYAVAAPDGEAPEVPEGGSLWLCFVGGLIRLVTSPPDPLASAVHTDGVVCVPW
jgi:hypothetical protein